jgi:hypothetical protein
MTNSLSISHAIPICDPRYPILGIPQFLGLAMSLFLVVEPSGTQADTGKTPDGDKITALIKQLGDNEFAKRKAASRKLQTIGEPVLRTLRHAAAFDDDLEIRRRSKAIIRAILRRMAEGAAKKELSKWQGTWRNGDQALVITGDYWWWGRIDQFRPNEFKKNRLRIVKVSEKLTVADLFVAFGSMKGKTCKAIFHLDGNTLHYSGSYKSRPTGFKDRRGYNLAWKRVKK